jgi:hypothetical protein
LEADFLQSLLETRELQQSVTAAMPLEGDGASTPSRNATPAGTKQLLSDTDAQMMSAGPVLSDKLAKQRVALETLKALAKVRLRNSRDFLLCEITCFCSPRGRRPRMFLTHFRSRRQGDTILPKNYNARALSCWLESFAIV